MKQVTTIILSCDCVVAELGKSNMQAANECCVVIGGQPQSHSSCLPPAWPTGYEVTSAAGRDHQGEGCCRDAPLHTDSRLRLLSFVILLCTLVSIF